MQLNELTFLLVEDHARFQFLVSALRQDVGLLFMDLRA